MTITNTDEFLNLATLAYRYASTDHLDEKDAIIVELNELLVNRGVRVKRNDLNNLEVDFSGSHEPPLSLQRIADKTTKILPNGKRYIVRNRRGPSHVYE